MLILNSNKMMERRLKITSLYLEMKSKTRELKSRNTPLRSITPKWKLINFSQSLKRRKKNGDNRAKPLDMILLWMHLMTMIFLKRRLLMRKN